MQVDGAPITTDSLSGVATPSYRIPPEIIAKVIRELLPAKIGYATLMEERLEVLLTATSICQYWRYAALDHATLWSVVPVDRKRLGELFLQRSRNAPLSITFVANPGSCSPHQAMVLLLPHVQRVRKVQLRAPIPPLTEFLSALNLYLNGAQLEEISIKVDSKVGRFHGNETSKVVLDLILEHAPTLKALRLDIFQCRFPANQLMQLSNLSHLELLSTTHDIRDVSSLLTSLTNLASIKIRANTFGTRERFTDRIVPQSTLRHIHLQFPYHPTNCVLDTLKIQTGVHLECDILDGGSSTPLPLPSEFFENTSGTEELRIAPRLYTGSGPNGSFCFSGDALACGIQPPIEDLSHLTKLVVDGSVYRQFLEDIVGSAPRLLSIGFICCEVIEPRTTDPLQKRLCSLVDVDPFTRDIGEEYPMGPNGEYCDGTGVSGTLEGERLEEFRSLLGNRS